VLVRPDVHVGWRCARVPADMTTALSDALGKILGKTKGNR
jgi:2,4-dichlorophenol 6-monooxygenase